jgi:hypothetical protein
MPRLPTRVFLLAVLGAAASCGSKGAAPEQKALASWAATLEVTTDQASTGALPADFASETLDQVERQLAAESKKIDQVESTPDSVRALRQGLTDAVARAARLRAALGR